MQLQQPVRSFRRRRWNKTRLRHVGFLIAAYLIASAGGCNSFGNSRLVKELQSENERLLSEFRAQRDRSSELEKANRLQAERLAESEKLLARLSQGGGAGRLSSLPQPNFSAPSSGLLNNNAAQADRAGSSRTPLEPLRTGQLRWQPRVGP